MADKFACMHCGFIFEDPDMEICPKCGTELGKEWDPAELVDILVTDLAGAEVRELIMIISEISGYPTNKIGPMLKNLPAVVYSGATPLQAECYLERIRATKAAAMAENAHDKSVRLKSQAEASIAASKVSVEQAKIKAEAEAKATTEAAERLAEANARAEADAKAKAESEAAKAQAEAEKVKAEAEAKKAEETAKAEAEAKIKAQAEAKKAEELAKAETEAKAKAEAEAEKAKAEAEIAKAKAEADAHAKVELEKHRMELDAQQARKRKHRIGIAAIIFVVAILVVSAIISFSMKIVADKKKANVISDLEILLKKDPFLSYESYRNHYSLELTRTEYDHIYEQQKFADARKKITQQKEEAVRLESEKKAKAKAEARLLALKDLQILLKQDPFLSYQQYTAKNPGKLTLAEYDGVYQQKQFADARQTASRRLSEAKQKEVERTAKEKKRSEEIAKDNHLWRLGQTVTYEIGNRVKLDMVFCQVGTFKMGSPVGEGARKNDERIHLVVLKKPFLIGKYEVTQEQYKEVMGKRPSYFQDKDSSDSDMDDMLGKKSDNLPVDSVNWYEAKEFCNRLNKITEGKRPANYEFRLPTEAEWECACRSGSTTAFYFGNSLNSNLANFDGNYPYKSEKGPFRKKTTPVGTFLCNEWEIYDMHGNLQEWCLDFYDQYQGSEVEPKGPPSGTYRVVRGGSWNSDGSSCRSAKRYMMKPETKNKYTGFRVVLVYVDRTGKILNGLQWKEVKKK